MRICSIYVGTAFRTHTQQSSKTATPEQHKPYSSRAYGKYLLRRICSLLAEQQRSAYNIAFDYESFAYERVRMCGVINLLRINTRAILLETRELDSS